MNVLVGDATGNGSINSADISQVKANVWVAVTQANFRSDVTANGGVNTSDVSAVKAAAGGAARSGG